MTDYTIGDRVRLLRYVGGDARAGDLGTVTEAIASGGLYAQFDGRHEGAEGDGIHWVGSGDVELVKPEPIARLEPGKRYRVTAVVEGVANDDGEIGMDTDNHTWRSSFNGAQRLTADATTIEEITPPEPAYQPGEIYRDAEDDVVLYAPEDDSDTYGGPWVVISANSNEADAAPGDRWFETTPVRPLTRLNLTEQ